ncbi:MAG: ABC-type transport auxiliary lipoprotein family protein [Sphingobium sp.]
MSIRPIRSPKRLMAMGLALIGLSGCVSFGTKPPPQLLTIRTQAAVAPGQTVNSQGLPSLLVMLPEVPRTIATTRVPVQIDPTSVAYVKNAQWTEAPRDMFHQLLTETITAGGVLFVIDEDQYGLKPRKRLSGDLLEFGLDGQTKEAVVTYEATLTDSASGEASRSRFTARVPVSDIRADRVAEPINQAANQVAQQIATWVQAG